MSSHYVVLALTQKQQKNKNVLTNQKYLLKKCVLTKKKGKKEKAKNRSVLKKSQFG